MTDIPKLSKELKKLGFIESNHAILKISDYDEVIEYYVKKTNSWKVWVK